MDYISLIGISFSLAMDAFAVSITNGASIKKVTPSFAFKLSLSFGIFQAIMPMIGWFVGKAGENFIYSVDHWIALILLSYLGINMIIESHKKLPDKSTTAKMNNISFKTLIVFSIATSIDALATGVILPSTVGASTLILMLISIAVIGFITFFLCMIGVYIGKNFGKICSSKSQVIGGIVLIIIGIKIFVEQVFFT